MFPPLEPGQAHDCFNQLRTLTPQILPCRNPVIMLCEVQGPGKDYIQALWSTVPADPTSFGGTACPRTRRVSKEASE